MQTFTFPRWFTSLLRTLLLLPILPVFILTAVAAGEADKPPVMLTQQETSSYLAVQAKISGNPKINIKRLDVSTGHAPGTKYRADEVELFIANETIVEKTATDEDLRTKSDGYQGSHTFPWLRLRRSYSDVLTAEDPSVINDKAKTKFDDLDAALFSYSRDFRSRKDTWTSQAALLAPFSFYAGYDPREGQGFGLSRWGFVPSVSLNRIATSGSAKGDLDQLTYRVGAFAKFRSGYDPLLAVTARVYATYLHDDLQDESVTAGQFDIEPVSYFKPGLQIGSSAILIPKTVKPDSKDVDDTAWLGYQLRTILHGEFGQLNKDGNAFTGKEYNFFRLGPVVQLDLKPVIFKELSISLKYQYLPALSGENPNDTLFTADAEWAIYTDKKNLEKLALKISYIDGGVDLTKEKVRTILVGLGAAF